MATTYASEYDPLSTATYDPQFTANISNRMQVPDSILVGGRDESPRHSTEESPRSKMKVPERILLAGDNQHVGMREEYWDMDSEYSKNVPSNHVGLSTPPRVLTIEDALPTETDAPRHRQSRGDPSERGDRYAVTESRNDRSFLNGLVSGIDTSYRSMTPPVPLSAELMADDSLMMGQEDEDVTLRRQVGRLQRHVIHLEEENDLRSRREMILYPTLLLYFLFQIGKWFVGRK